jgi:pyruvate/2-oxoglutarate dehydrogenase complex dihydrolipoamide acyltransferase (E2) component
MLYAYMIIPPHHIPNSGLVSTRRRRVGRDAAVGRVAAPHWHVAGKGCAAGVVLVADGRCHERQRRLVPLQDAGGCVCSAGPTAAGGAPTAVGRPSQASVHTTSSATTPDQAVRLAQARALLRATPAAGHAAAEHALCVS